jgi:hypothetical protein
MGKGRETKASSICFPEIRAKVIKDLPDLVLSIDTKLHPNLKKATKDE